MKRAFLEELGLEKEVVDKIMKQHGDDIEEYKTKNTELTNNVSELDNQIKEKDSQITKLGEDLKNVDNGSEEIQKLKDLVKKYEDAEKERKANEDKAAKDKALTDNILETIGDKEFVNDFTKNSIINQIKEDLGKEENNGKGIKDIFESLTKDADNIFKNPQHQNLDIPKNGNPGGGNDDDAAVRKIMGLPPLK